MLDYGLYIVFRIVVFCMRFLPLCVWLFFARRLGGLYYYAARKSNRRAYANLKTAFGFKSSGERKAILKEMYRRFSQNFVEALYLVYMDAPYIKRCVKIPDIAVVEEVLAAERGAIFLGVHAGSWELSNIACATLFSALGGGRGFRYAMLAQPQSRYVKLDFFLNALRESKGCGVIRVDELKKMVAHLSGNNVLGSVVDHGGKDGIGVEFFGKPAMTPVGSIRLAQKLGSQIILAFMRRTGGAYHEMSFKKYDLVKTGDASQDTAFNLKCINKIFEEWITRYPEEYLWSYKRWKYSPQKNVLVLSDGKTGHTKQSLAIVDMVRSLGFSVRQDVVNLEYRRKRFNVVLTLIGFLFGSRAARIVLPFFLRNEIVQRIASARYDIVVSAGSSVAVVNLAIAQEDDAKSFVVMRPGIFSMGRFDLVALPEHDRPPKKDNVLTTMGSLNTVSSETMKADFDNLATLFPVLKESESQKNFKVGLLIGGHSKNYKLTHDMVVFLCEQIRRALDDFDGHLFLTTSRRTSREAIAVLKKYFKDNARCKLFVVAAEDNPAGTIGGIFYLSDCLIVSGESISMVSEALGSGKHTIVFEPRSRTKDNKVKRFLNFLSEKNYIYLLKLNEIYDKLSWIASARPEHPLFNNRIALLDKLEEIL